MADEIKDPKIIKGIVTFSGDYDEAIKYNWRIRIHEGNTTSSPLYDQIDTGTYSSLPPGSRITTVTIDIRAALFGKPQPHNEKCIVTIAPVDKSTRNEETPVVAEWDVPPAPPKASFFASHKTLLIFIGVLALVSLGFYGLVRNGTLVINKKNASIELEEKKLVDQVKAKAASDDCGDCGDTDTGPVPNKNLRPEKVKIVERPPLVGKKKSHHGQREIVQESEMVREWPEGEIPEITGDIIGDDCVYPPTATSANIPTVLKPQVNSIYNTPAGWDTMIEVLDSNKILIAFNVGSEVNPTWISNRKYKGGSVIAFWIKNITQTPIPINFKLRRLSQEEIDRINAQTVR